MNFDRSLIFSYLEEDNIQRAYFRVKPLLSLDGDIRQEALQLWPNEGGLRIVPDRNEQHTFKLRMRKLGSYCVIDLRDQPAEAGKIRTNKNYKPERGEVNQYILYSDTVHELPEHTFFQLIEGEAANYQDICKDAITPLFYIQQGETLYGPIYKEAPGSPEPAQEATGMLFSLPCPDGVIRQILCMEEGKCAVPASPQEAEVETVHDFSSSSGIQTAPAEPEPVAETVHAEPSSTDELPIGESLQILAQPDNPDETLRQLDKPVSDHANLLHHNPSDSLSLHALIQKDASLSGTPLIRKPLHMAALPAKNHTQEVISSQWSVGKYEPPAQNLPVGTSMRAVDNPVETACTALREAWRSTHSHEQLIDFVMSLEGLRPLLEKKLCNGEGVTMMQRVLRQRLQDLEAERLTALCELDRANRDVDTYKQELMSAMTARITRETSQLEENRQTALAQVEVLKHQINALTLQRDALLTRVQEINSCTLPEAVAKLTADAQMSAPVSGIPLRIHPVSGNNTGLDDLIARIQKACSDSGVSADRNTAIAMIVLLAISPRIGISCPTPAAVSTLCRNLAAALGWQSGYAHQYSAEQHPLVGARPIDSTPAVLTTSLPNFAPMPGVTKLMLNRNTANLVKNAAYDVGQWPILTLPALPFIPELRQDDATPVSASSLLNAAVQEDVSANELDAILTPILRAALPLGGAAQKEMYRFVSICAGLMDGGLPVAADWGILLWVIPALERGSRTYIAVKALLDEYPLSLSKM